MYPTRFSDRRSGRLLVNPIFAHLFDQRRALQRQQARCLRNDAVGQVERIDVLVRDLGRRAEETMSTAQHFVNGPARNGAAVVAGVRAGAVGGRRSTA